MTHSYVVERDEQRIFGIDRRIIGNYRHTLRHGRVNCGKNRLAVLCQNDQRGTSAGQQAFDVCKLFLWVGLRVGADIRGTDWVKH